MSEYKPDYPISAWEYLEEYLDTAGTWDEWTGNKNLNLLLNYIKEGHPITPSIAKSLEEITRIKATIWEQF